MLVSEPGLIDSYKKEKDKFASRKLENYFFYKKGFFCKSIYLKSAPLLLKLLNLQENLYTQLFQDDIHCIE